IISIGDYILTGGELPTMVIVDSVVRLMPGVLNKEESTREESFNNNLLEYPQYTRPETYKNMRVPKVLVSGHHGEIEKWRKKQSMVKTKKNRPDLL
ncbi:MAG: tRNA (guanine-N(1)-)-methyltransferase, partial [Microgenomates group bacterium GW2011_GWA2_44_7]